MLRLERLGDVQTVRLGGAGSWSSETEVGRWSGKQECPALATVHRGTSRRGKEPRRLVPECSAGGRIGEGGPIS